MKKIVEDKSIIKKTKLKLFFWVIVISAIFAFIPFFLIVKNMSRLMNQAGSVYMILFSCNFAVFYLLVMVTYSNRVKMEKRRQEK